MSKLIPIHNETAHERARALLEGVNAKLKMTPNFMRVMANSPAVLEGYLAFSGALAGGLLHLRLREQIALAVGERNGCEYCVSAHTALGKMAGLADAEIALARDGRSRSAKDAAALEFAAQIVDRRGRVANAEFEAVREAGFSDGEIAEILAHVALNVFTNYFNTANEMEVDFPKIALLKTA